MRSWPEFYNPWLSIAGYCAERVYRDEEVDLDRFLDQFQAPNGSIANSPAASAFFLLETERRGQAIVPERGARLRQYIHSRTPESIGYLDHVPHFVTAWSVMFENEVEHPLAHSHPAIAELCRELAHPSGLLCTVGATTIPGDTDSTACAMIAARIMERPTPATSSLDRMFDASEGAYRTFYFEHDLSLTTNIHMAGLLDLDGDRDRLAMLLAWLDRQTAHENTTCKWHLSPVYTMGEMARVLASVDHPVARSLAAVAARRLLNTQNGDGGWGHHGSTTEETAYSVLGVASVMRHGLVTPDISPALAQAHMFLTTRNPELTPLWLGKTLYCVQPLVPILRTVATQRLEQL
ncbi:hypothetical protein CFP75_39895 [Amycolatopsis alba DSM 44262]|uniref:Squalene cyclase C-terminal domain-containing protein n=2 Tax=Amycolatopsis alba TaxID=76020 RepID=A0A229R9A8_AMYAL|nr:hypothetical protein CFP75_39895 [Amycolatopsis alba DSM 44262]